jgi:hypothetical protein
MTASDFLSRELWRVAILSRFLRKDAPSVEESVTDVCSCISPGHCTRLRSVASANATLYYANASNRLLLTGQASPSAQATPVPLGLLYVAGRCPLALGTEQRTFASHEPQSARRPVWLSVRRFRSGRTDLGLQNSSFADRKPDSQSVGFRLNGTHLGLAKLHVAHSKTKRDPESGSWKSNNSFILNNMAERVGFDYRHF